MPIYEYRCSKGHTFEVMQRMTDDPVSVCAVCSRPVERVFHPIAVHFKGSGFYNTDYGTKRRQRESGDSAKSETKAGETKADSSPKPEKPASSEKAKSAD